MRKRRKHFSFLNSSRKFSLENGIKTMGAGVHLSQRQRRCLPPKKLLSEAFLAQFGGKAKCFWSSWAKFREIGLNSGIVVVFYMGVGFSLSLPGRREC